MEKNCNYSSISGPQFLYLLPPPLSSRSLASHSDASLDI